MKQRCRSRLKLGSKVSVCLALNSSIQVFGTALRPAIAGPEHHPCVHSLLCPGTLPYAPSPTPIAAENPGDKDMAHKPEYTLDPLQRIHTAMLLIPLKSHLLLSLLFQEKRQSPTLLNIGLKVRQNLFDKNVKNNILYITAITKSLSWIATVLFLLVMLIFSWHIIVVSHLLLYLFLGVYSLWIPLLFPSEVCHNKSSCSKFLKNKTYSDLFLPFWGYPSDCVRISHCCMVKAFFLLAGCTFSTALSHVKHLWCK